MATSLLPDLTAQPALAASIPVVWTLRRAAVAGVVAVYLLSVSANWYMLPDSALYLMLAQNLRAGEGYTLWGAPHAHVPPGYPTFLAAMMEVGLGGYVWLNFSMILMGLATLWLSFKYLSDRATAGMAFLICMSLAYSHEMHMASILILSDMFFMLLVWIALYCYNRGLKEEGWWLEAGTLAMIACCWVRVAGFPLAAAAAIGLALELRQVSRRRVWLNSAGLLVGIGLSALLFYQYHHRVTQTFTTVQTYSGYVGTMASRSSHDWLWQPPKNFLTTGRGILRVFTGQQHNSLGLWAISLVWIPIVLGMARGFRRRQFLGLSCVLGYVVVLSINESLMARYLLPLAPLLFWYFFEGMQAIVAQVVRLANLHPKHASASRVAFVLTLVFITFNMPRLVSYTYYVHKPEAQALYASWQSVRQAATFLQQHARPEDRFLTTDHQRQISYLSNTQPARLACGSFNLTPPSPEELDALLDANVAFVVKWHGMRPELEQMVDAAIAQHGYRPVFANQHCDIFTARPLVKMHAVARKVAIVARNGQLADLPTAVRQ